MASRKHPAIEWLRRFQRRKERSPALARALERALARNVKPAVYTEDMFKTTHDAANREVVKAVIRAELNLVGLAMRAERKVIDKIVDGLKFHS